MNEYQELLRTWMPRIGATLFIVALAELCWLRYRGRAFDWRETANSVFISIGQRGAGLLGASLYAGVFYFAWQHRLFDIDMALWWSFPLLFLGQEFFYYWEHRLSHECRWFWASHVVHHSPNYLNLSAAYRLSWTAPFTGQHLIFLPLVWLGFHPGAVFAMLAVNLLYQFWLHTELVPRMPWFDAIFNSPSNHRVHHAANLAYLDANYGGILIIFDRLFGTYIPERADLPCRFGLVQPMHTQNPLRIVFQEWGKLARDVYQANDWRARLGYLYRAPGWQPNGVGATTRDLRKQEAQQAAQNAAQNAAQQAQGAQTRSAGLV